MTLRAVLRGGAFLVVGLVGFGAGVYADQAFPDWIPYIAHHQTGNVDTTELQEAIRVIQAEYVDGNLDTTKMSQGSVRGLMASLGDPYSAYYDPDQYKKLQAAYEGRYSGIGIYVNFGSGYPVITGTVPGSPAAQAGLQSGDQIVKIGGRDAKGLTADVATSLIQGPDGTKVTLTVKRDTSTFDVDITRAEIQIPSVRSTVIGDHVLYVRIFSFGSSTAADFLSVLTSNLSSSKTMVLDLRDNPGGFVDQADAVISDFVASGETFEEHGRNGAVDHHSVSGDHPAAAIPLVVLVNGNSASAAEIVAGSLQVHRRAKLVGAKTFGKGSEQQDFPLTDGSDLHLTIKRWFLPDGSTVDHVGLTPDLSVALANSDDEFDVQQPAAAIDKDIQLAAALSLLAAK
ncbi:MAG TPA: S41 family peptidase [Candidatus Dormibacteraeota bacterium]|nr:S41 family peptidase [Candidatus Dormibacteraeota bacterium]